MKLRRQPAFTLPGSPPPPPPPAQTKPPDLEGLMLPGFLVSFPGYGYCRTIRTRMAWLERRGLVIPVGRNNRDPRRRYVWKHPAQPKPSFDGKSV
ncbi:MAG: hypothetical protein LBK99_19285 [Opitutaceae bacterium]|nr:hypothetical protein [Opitutaceae bacterium]